MVMALRTKSGALASDTTIDPWTGVHFAAGMGFGLARIHPIIALPVFIIWEVVEKFVISKIIPPFGVETLANRAVDFLADLAGYLVGMYVAWRMGGA